MEIEYLKRFVAVGKTLNFRKAADILYISQPTLSHSITNLEKLLGAPLFIRDTKAVSLTTEGEAFLPVAQEIVEKYEEAVRSIFYENPDEANLKIGYVGPTLDNTINPWLTRFHRLYPEANIELTHYNGRDIKDIFAKQSVQIAVMYEENAIEIPKSNYEIVETERYRLLVNLDHPFASRESVTLEEISKEPLIIWDRQRYPFFHSKIMSFFEKEKLIPNIRRSIENAGDIYRLVSVGTGIAIMSYSTLREYGQYDLKFIPIDGVDEPHNRVLCWCQNLSPVGRKFRKVVKDNPVS